jgi:hypothetical protein
MSVYQTLPVHRLQCCTVVRYLGAARKYRPCRLLSAQAAAVQRREPHHTVRGHCGAAEPRVVAGNPYSSNGSSADAVCARLDEPHRPVRPEGVRPTLFSSNEIRIAGPIPVFIDRGCPFETHTNGPHSSTSVHSPAIHVMTPGSILSASAALRHWWRLS